MVFGRAKQAVFGKTYTILMKFMVPLFSCNSAFGPKDLEDVLTSVRRTKRKLNKLSVMFNGTGGQGVGNFIAKDTTVREVRTAKKTNKQTDITTPRLETPAAAVYTTDPAPKYSTPRLEVVCAFWLLFEARWCKVEVAQLETMLLA